MATKTDEDVLLAALSATSNALPATADADVILLQCLYLRSRGEGEIIFGDRYEKYTLANKTTYYITRGNQNIDFDRGFLFDPSGGLLVITSSQEMDLPELLLIMSGIERISQETK